jgi:hypothetical protein
MEDTLKIWKENNPGYVNLGPRDGSRDNWYCAKTGSHFYDGHSWSKELWDEWLNELND